MLSYPATVQVPEETIKNGCIVTAGTFKSDPVNCVKVEGARMFRIKDAIPAAYEGDVSIEITF
jgi:hypothetical protein